MKQPLDLYDLGGGHRQSWSTLVREVGGGPWWYGSVWPSRDFCWVAVLVLSCLCRAWLSGRWSRKKNRGAARPEEAAQVVKGTHVVKVAAQPSAIFHGLHKTFDELRAILPGLAAAGFDAVQLPPAQVSPAGDLRAEWYLRYQPLRWGTIDPLLGGEGALKKLCAEASRLGILVVADCVFNHAAAVASRAEWEAAQNNAELLEELRCRLDSTFAPELSREDFVLPWDEGWGCGALSELCLSEHVLEVHLGHLKRLLHCGVRGFCLGARAFCLDAAQHAQPSHVRQVGQYVDFLQKEGAFVYTEVSSVDQEVHSHYEALGNKLQPVRSMDYLLAKQVKDACSPSKHGGGPPPFLPQLAALAGSGLGPGAIRFVRNHFTALNGGPALCGINWSCAEDAKLAWAYLLAAPEGSIMLYEEDAAVPLVQRALAFRRAVAQKASQNTALAVEGMGSVEFELTAAPTTYDPVILLVRLRGKSSCAPLGMVVLSFGEKRQRQRPKTPTRPRSNSNSPSLRPVPAPAVVRVPWDLGRGARLVEVLGGELKVNGSWSPRLGQAFQAEEGLQQSLDAANFFLVEAPLGDCAPAPRDLVLHYRSAWQAPHLHFGVQGEWTAAPGWPFRRLAAGPVPGQDEGADEATSWWRVSVPLAEGCEGIEFVLNDGGSCWHHAKRGGNYMVNAPGSYIVEDGQLRKIEMGEGEHRSGHRVVV